MLELFHTLHWVLPVDVFALVIIDSCQDHLRFILWSQNLNERVFMSKSFFTHLTVVKVLADAAFISDARDRTDPTAVTCNLQVLDDLISVDL